jgi:hypothetical protein
MVLAVLQPLIAVKDRMFCGFRMAVAVIRTFFASSSDEHMLPEPDDYFQNRISSLTPEIVLNTGNSC